MIIIILIVAGIIAVIELRKSSDITLALARQKTMYLARQQAQYWDGRMNGYINVLRSLSNIMNFYESLEPSTRRQTYEDTIQSVFEDMPDFVRIFTVWKPNAIDGMDARNIGRAGSTPAGQFAFSVTRESGEVKVMTSAAVQETMEYITGSASRAVIMSDPVPFKNQGKDTYCVRITVPILNKRLNEVVGAVGCQLDIAMIQPIVIQTIKDNDEVTSMVIYSDNGFILANYLPEFIGKKIETETQYGQYLDKVIYAIKNAEEYECFAYDPELKQNMAIAIVNIPIGASPTTWSVMTGSTEKYIMREVNAMKKFVVFLAVLALAAAAALIYLVLNSAARPIVRVD